MRGKLFSKISTVLASLAGLVAAVVYFLPPPAGVAPVVMHAAALMLLTVGLWATAVVPEYVASLLFFLLIAGDTFLRKLVEVLPRFSDKRRAVEISQQIESDSSGYLLTITAMNVLRYLLRVGWPGAGSAGSLAAGTMGMCRAAAPWDL